MNDHAADSVYRDNILTCKRSIKLPQLRGRGGGGLA